MSALVIAAKRESVLQAYNSAKAENNLRFLEEDEKATSEYIYDNQKYDAVQIVQYVPISCNAANTCWI